jgi:hypothetical protein
METVHTNGGAPPQDVLAATVPKTAPKPRPRLAGPAHIEGWAPLARAVRAQLKAAHRLCPPYPPKGGHEAVAKEAAEHIHLLDSQCLNLQHFVLAELVKLSRR